MEERIADLASFNNSGNRGIFSMHQAITQSAGYKWWAFGAIAIGTFISVVSHGSMIVALPTITEKFDTDLPTAQWVVIGETLTISALLLPMGRLSDIVGRKRVYIAGLVIFVIGSALAAFAPNIVVLIIWKVLQGGGAAMSQGTATAMITSIFPSSERGKALGGQGSVVGSGAVVGPPLGGILVGSLGWEWIFFINIPVGILAIAAALAVLDERRFTHDSRLRSYDWLGMALSIAFLVTFLLAITNGYKTGWLSPPIIGAFLITASLLVAFIWWELSTPSPMLDLRLFKRRLFSAGVAAAFISFLGIASIRFLMPFYLQTVQGYSPGQVGLIMIPNALCMILIRPLSGALSDRYGWKYFTVGGMTLSAVGVFLLSRLTETSALGLVMTGMILQSSGMATFGSPNQSSVFSAVERQRYGVVSALVSLVRNSANITSIAVTTAIVTATMSFLGYPPSLGAISEAQHAFTSGLRTAFLVMGVLLAVGIVISLLTGERVQDRSASESETLKKESPSG